MLHTKAIRHDEDITPQNSQQKLCSPSLNTLHGFPYFLSVLV